MLKQFWQYMTRRGLIVASLLAGLALSGCASYVTSDVTAFSAWGSNGSDRERTYTFERNAAQRNSIEQSTYERLVADELSRYNFRQVDPGAAHYAVELEYGTHSGSVIVRQAVYTDPWWPGWGPPGPWGPWGPWGPFGPGTPTYVDQALPVFFHTLTIRMTERGTGKEAYKVTATTPSVQQSLPVSMPYLVRSALADFPLQNSTTRQVRLPADLRTTAAGTSAKNSNENAVGAAPASSAK
jgi:Domain of unknown function (DUF4136)